MPSPGSDGPGFFQVYGYIVWPILGVLAGLVLTIGGYAIWRGPHRSFFPPAFISLFRRNVVRNSDNDLDDEKRITPMGKVPSPAPIASSRRIETGRRGKNETISQADEFKREVERQRMSGAMEWVEPDHRRQGAGGGGMILDSPTISESGTLVGSPLAGRDKMVFYDHQAQVPDARTDTDLAYDQSSPHDQIENSNLPKRRSSLDDGPVAVAVIDGTPIRLSAIPLYPSLPPTASTGHPSNSHARRQSHANQYQHHQAGGRRMSIVQDRHQPVSRSREQRSGRSYPVRQTGGFVNNMKEGEDSDVW